MNGGLASDFQPTVPRRIYGVPPRRVFLQYLNPELTALYKVPRRRGAAAATQFRTALTLTRYALLVADEELVVPASYLFEVKAFKKFLDTIEPACGDDLLVIATPALDIDFYVRKKRAEYPDQLDLYGSNGKRSSALPRGRIVDRRYRSSDGITQAWHRELAVPGGLWQRLLARGAGRTRPVPSKLETQIDAVPERLNGRAFIYRYAEPLLPALGLDQQDATAINKMINRSYLESYLEEYDAAILAPTPFGDLDCDLPRTNEQDRLRVVPLRTVERFFGILQIRTLIEERLNWGEIVELRAQPVFRHVIARVIHEGCSEDRPLQTAMALAQFKGSRPPAVSGRPAYDHILRELFRFLDQIGPFLPDALTFQSGSRDGQLVVSLGRAANDQSHGEVLQIPTIRRQIAERTRSMADPNTVFLVHGRDTRASDSMRLLLRAMGLSPIEWEDAVNLLGTPSPFILDVVKAGFGAAQAALVLFTPDEQVQLRDTFATDREKAATATPEYQPRPNVLIEAGMAFALQPERTVIVEIGDLRPASDLAGIHAIRFDGSATSRLALLNRLQTAGCMPKSTARDFSTVGFEYLKKT